MRKSAKDFIMGQAVGLEDSQRCVVYSREFGFTTYYNKEGNEHGAPLIMPYAEARKARDLARKQVPYSVKIGALDRSTNKFVRLESLEKDFIRNERLYLIMLTEPELPTIPPRYLKAAGEYRHDAVPWVNNQWVNDKAAASAFHLNAAKEWILNEKARGDFRMLTPVPVDEDPRDEANAQRWMRGESLVKDFIQGEKLYVIAMHGKDHKPFYLKSRIAHRPDEVPGALSGRKWDDKENLTWVRDKAQASVFNKETAQNWCLTRSEQDFRFFMPEPVSESQAKDFIMAQKGDRTWEVNVGPDFTSGGVPHRMVYVLWHRERIAKIRATAPRAELLDVAEKLTERIYAVYLPLKQMDQGDITTSPEARSTFIGWWHAGLFKDIIQGKLLMDESVVKDFLGKVSNDWTFHLVDRDPQNLSIIYIWIQCNGTAVYYWVYDQREQGPLRKFLPHVEKALKEADRKEPFNPGTNNPWKADEFISWAKRTGIINAFSGKPPVQEVLDARKFIMQQTPPSTWGELKVGDMMHSENGAVLIVTKQHDRPGYSHEPVTLYDEYNPCYAYTERGGPFVQHYSRPSREPIVGETFIGTREQNPGDLWQLMKKLNAKRWPEQCSEAVNIKKFIQRQPAMGGFTFKVEPIEDRGWDKYRTRIYFNNEEVALTYTAKRPPVYRWKWWLNKANAVIPFIEDDNNFWDWLRLKHKKGLSLTGLKPMVHESQDRVNVRKFIQQFGNTWAFQQSRHPEWPGFQPGLLKIFCNGVLVGAIRHGYGPMKTQTGATNHTRGPDLKWIKDVLENGDQKELFIPGQDSLWGWLHKRGTTLMPFWSVNQYTIMGPDDPLLTQVNESIEPKDFIMHQVPSVESVARNFALEKVKDEYKGGELLYDNTGAPEWNKSWTIRAQEFRGFVHLNKPVPRELQEPLSRIDIEVFYWEDKWGTHTVRIDIRDMAGRMKKIISTRNEAKVAEYTERSLNRLVRALGAMRSTKIATLHRVLATLGFHSR